MPDRATAFAPATVANVAVGFDVLGFTLAEVGDRVSVVRDPDLSDVVIESISGVVTDLPTDPAANTASVALRSLMAGRGIRHGFRIRIDKGIPLGSGMGGSAASAVAAVVAAAGWIDPAPSREELLRHALAGERVAAGAAHADNAAPCLWGGLVAVTNQDPVDIVSIPTPDGLVTTLIHPHLEVATRDARAALPGELPLGTHVRQSMALASFLAGCFRGDAQRVGRSMIDLVAEPTRSRFIPGFDEAREAATAAGALSFAIAGSGPSVFAWSESVERGRAVESAVRAALARHGVASDGWVAPLAGRGAHVEDEGRPR